MENSHLMLDKVMRGIEGIDGLIFYSIFQLPFEDKLRRKVMFKIIESNRSIHFASEKIILDSVDDAQKIEMMLQVEKFLPFCPSAEDLSLMFSKTSTRHLENIHLK